MYVINKSNSFTYMLSIKAIEQKYKFIKIDMREGGMYLPHCREVFKVTSLFSNVSKAVETPTQGPTE